MQADPDFALCTEYKCHNENEGSDPFVATAIPCTVLRTHRAPYPSLKMGVQKSIMEKRTILVAMGVR